MNTERLQYLQKLYNALALAEEEEMPKHYPPLKRGYVLEALVPAVLRLLEAHLEALEEGGDE